MRKKIGIVMMMVLLLGLIVVSQMAGEYLFGRIEKGKSIPTAGNAEEIYVVVDSGHGGFDPGKVGVNDVLEKEINLQIAKKVKANLEKQNIKVIMTREKDESLADTKVEDLKARVELINEKKPTLTVSIHQNSYHEESIHGAQVFYFTHSKEGEEAAQIMQKALLAADPENHRAEKANDTYYILKKTEAPVIIVECGFLSNQKEAGQLCDKAYQEKLARAITGGVIEYIEK